MAAKDYKICIGIHHAYIGKVSKRNPHLMLEDRVEISEGRIMALIGWWLEKRCEETNSDTQYISSKGTTIIELKKLDFKKKEK